ncbi:DUF4288 domain-containing protein [Streptosporangium sp. NPDC020145]|uniref:DUF4288 domain-containing protein n=2 Tax=Streptosporangium jomthongense TaxID=1193683 RepID=A0ABV8F6V9_9ACTN
MSRLPYMAILVFEVIVKDGRTPSEYTEDFVVLYEESDEKAHAAAEAMGREEETSYRNQYGETVEWKFLGTADVRAALYDDLSSETSLYTRGFSDISRYRDLFSVSLPDDGKEDRRPG